ncbi:MAG: hypothetical protein AB8B53_10980 [Flavobacteriales bacterium]
MNAQLKTIGERIKFNRTPQQTSIKISQRVKPWQEALIAAWVLLWLTCGFFYLSHFLLSESSEQKAVILGFLLVWSYLLFKAIQILLWRIIGSEDVEISKGKLTYKKSYSGLGRAKVVNLEDISEFGLIGYTEKSFKKSMESYFWSMGAETIGFKTPRRYFLLGMQLQKKDAKLLSELMNASIKKMKD